MSFLYNDGKANGVTDDLNRIAMNIVSHVEDGKIDLVNEEGV